MKREKNQIKDKRRKFTAVSAAALTLLVAAVCFLTMSAYRLPFKYDMTNDRIFTLSQETEAVLKELPGKVKIGAVYPEGKAEPVVESLLSEYEKASDNIEVEYVDAEKNPAGLSNYNLGDVVSVINGTLIVEGHDRVKLINNADLFTSDTNGNVFYGESEITGAIRYVTSRELPVVCFTQGHGELDAGTELTEAVSYLGKSAYESRSLVMVEEGIPQDTDIVAMISPEKDIDESEKETLERFLDKGGRLFVTMDPFLNANSSKFENLGTVLGEYGIDITNNFVVEEDDTYHLSSGNTYLIPRYGAHDITRELGESKKLVVFPLARGLGAGEYDETNVKRETLLVSSDQSWARNDVTIQAEGRTQKDVPGPIALGFAATKSNRKSGDYASQVVVLGDSDFIKNGNFKVQANGELFGNSIHWLQGDRTSEIIAGKVMNSDTMIVRNSTFVKLAAICCLVLPLLAFMAGLATWSLRRNR